MFVKLALKCPACLLLAGCLSLFAAAQQTSSTNSDSPQQQNPAPAQAQTPTPQQPQDKDSAPKSNDSATGQGKVAGTSNDRLFYTLPNFLTLPDKGKIPPLSVKDKFKVVALGSFDPVEFPWWAVLSAIEQASNSEPAFGQGWEAYAKRYGTLAGDSLVENFMVGAVFPSALRQDPRFYQSGKGGFFRRTAYAASRIVVTRGDSGHTQFNFSEVFGAYTAACVSTYTYHPRSTFLSTPSNPHLFVPSDRTFKNTVSTWGTQISLDTLTLFVKEFWPDIHRAISHRKASAAAAQP